ncbi:MAG: DUF3592 domain-containing protein [Verrucomicrobiota bacterium]
MEIDQTAAFICGALGIILSTYTIGKYLQAKASLNWPNTVGKILKSEIIESTSGTRSSRRIYKANVDYTYCVNDVFYDNNVVSAFQYSTSIRNQAAQVVRRYPAGKEVEVYYKPAKPEVATLEKGVQRPLGLALLAFVSVSLISIGLVGLYRFLTV